MAYPTEGRFIHCFQIKFKFRRVGFCGWRKSREPRKKIPWVQGENSTHLWCKIQDWNPIYTGEKEITLTTVLSLLPCNRLWVKPKGKLKRMMFQPVCLGHYLFTSHHSLCSDCSVYAITLFHCHAINLSTAIKKNWNLILAVTKT